MGLDGFQIRGPYRGPIVFTSRTTLNINSGPYTTCYYTESQKGISTIYPFEGHLIPNVKLVGIGQR